MCIFDFNPEMKELVHAYRHTNTPAPSVPWTSDARTSTVLPHLPVPPLLRFRAGRATAPASVLQRDPRPTSPGRPGSRDADATGARIVEPARDGK